MRWLLPRPPAEVRALVAVGLPRWLRPARAATCGVVVLVVSLLTLLLAGTALADGPDGRSGAPGGSQTAVEHPGPGATEGKAQAAKDEGKSKPDSKESKKAKAQAAFDKLVAQRKEAQAVHKGVLSAFDVRDRDGSPVSIYTVQADTGSWKQWDLKVENLLVQFGFQINLWLVCLACWLIAWALSFSLAALLLRPVMHISHVFYDNVLVEMGLPSLFLTFAGLVAAWHWMFGNKARGWGEVLAALVISALTAGLLASPPTLLLSRKDGAVGQARNLSIEVAAMALSDLDPGKDAGKTTIPAGEAGSKQLSREISRPITDAVVDVFAVRASMLLSYGQVYTGDCSRRFRDMRVAQAVYEDELDKASGGKPAIDKAVTSIPVIGDWLENNRKNSLKSEADNGLTGNDDTDQMRLIINQGPIKDFEHKCVKGSAAQAKKASPEKTISVFFLIIATLIAAVFIVVVVAGYLNAQFWLACEAALAKVVLAVGVLPGPGRGWLWARASAILKWLGMLIASVIALAVFIVVITALMEAREKDLPGGLAVRFVIIDFAAIAGFIYRKKLTHTASSLANRARARMGNSPFGGSSPAAPINGPRRRGLGRAVLAASLLAGGTGGTSAARRVMRQGARAVRATARGTVGTAGVMAKGAGIIAGATGRAGTAAARTVATTGGRSTVRAHLGRLRSQVGVGLPAHVPADASGLHERMDRLRHARDARQRLATIRAARTSPSSGAAARRRAASEPAAGAPRRSATTAPPTGRRTTPAAHSPRGPERAPTPPTPPATRPSSRRARFTPPTSRPPVWGPNSPIRRHRPGRRR